jgi:flagellar hook-associated protein 1
VCEQPNDVHGFWRTLIAAEQLFERQRMTQLFGVLNAGINGLQAATFGESVTADNASNVGIDGYTRKIAQITPLQPGFSGGAQAKAAIREADFFVDRRLVSSQSLLGESQARAQTLGVFDTVFSSGSGSLSSTLDAFESAISDLASSPSEGAARSTLLQRAEQLAMSFQQSSSDLATARSDANARIVDTVKQVNSLLGRIADLNTQIEGVELAGQDASSAIDRRDVLVREVAKYVPVTVLRASNDRVTLLLSGSLNLVNAEDGRVDPLIAATDASSGDIHIFRVIAGAKEDITDRITSGAIGGMITARDGALKDAQNGLDQLAYDFINGYNSVHAAGVGLDGETGRNLFEPVSGVDGAAANFRVSADLEGYPDHIAAATDALALPGDNRGALALQDLQSSALSGGRTAADQLQLVVSGAGSALQGSNMDQEHAEAVNEQMVNLRESISGVSSDEEMVSLTRYQRAYQASVKVIEVANTMLDALMNMT